MMNWRLVRSTRKHHFVRLEDRHLLAIGKTDCVIEDVDSGRLRTIPEELRSRFQLVPEDG